MHLGKIIHSVTLTYQGRDSAHISRSGAVQVTVELIIGFKNRRLSNGNLEDKNVPLPATAGGQIGRLSAAGGVLCPVSMSPQHTIPRARATLLL